MFKTLEETAHFGEAAKEPFLKSIARLAAAAGVAALWIAFLYCLLAWRAEGL